MYNFNEFITVIFLNNICQSFYRGKIITLNSLMMSQWTIMEDYKMGFNQLLAYVNNWKLQLISLLWLFSYFHFMLSFTVVMKSEISESQIVITELHAELYTELLLYVKGCSGTSHFCSECRKESDPTKTDSSFQWWISWSTPN